MNSSSVVTGYIAILIVVGLGMVIFGTLLPLGGGTALATVGAAAIGAGLVLIGVRMISTSRQQRGGTARPLEDRRAGGDGRTGSLGWVDGT